MSYIKSLTLAAAFLLGAIVCSHASAATSAKAASAAAAQRVETEKIVRDYLLEHPELIREAMSRLQQREAAADAVAKKQILVAHRDELLADPASPVLGNPDGDVTVVEFFDYRCGYCKYVAPVLEALLAGDSNVRLVLKEFPILGPDSLLAAQAALAAKRQGRYKEFHAALMAAKQVDEAAINATATELGLDMDKFRADRGDAATTATIEKNQQLAGSLDINGTPAFVIGDRLVPGAADASALAAYIAEVRHNRGVESK